MHRLSAADLLGTGAEFVLRQGRLMTSVKELDVEELPSSHVYFDAQYAPDCIGTATSAGKPAIVNWSDVGS